MKDHGTAGIAVHRSTMASVTEVLILDASQPDPAGIARAAGILKGGGLVAFPPETVYGLGVHALDADAVAHLFTAKGRPANDPLIVHVHHFDALAALTAAVPDTARALASRFWPGPLTMVLQRSAVVPREAANYSAPSKTFGPALRACAATT